MVARVRGAFTQAWPHGFGLAALLVLIVIPERFDAALARVGAVREAGGQDGSVAPSELLWVWVGVAVLGVIAGAILLSAAHDAVRATIAHQQQGTTLLDAQKSGSRVLRWGGIALALWTVWQLSGAVLVRLDLPLPPGVRTALHAAAVALAIAALLAAADVLVDAGSAWRRTTLVRVHVIVLAALLAIVFVVPLTAAQTAEVFRAWAEQSAARWMAAAAAALLLGAVLRLSAVLILLPPRETASRSWVAFGLCVGVALVSLGLHGWVGAGAGAIGAVLAFCARPAPFGTEGRDRRRAKLLAGALSVVPLAILLVGITGATTDSWITPGDLDEDDWQLLGYTVLTGLALALVTGEARAERPEQIGPHTRPRRRRIAAAVLGLAAGVAAAAPGFASTDPWIAAGLAVPLLAVGVGLALGRFDRRDALALWAALGVVAGVAGSIYGDPVDSPRALGAVAVALLGATAVLLVLHAVARWGDRWRVRGRTVYVVTLIGAWVAIAFVLPVDTAHQAVTIRGPGQDPVPVESAVRQWLYDQGGGTTDLSMLLVGASGGGAKAAFWTDLVLDCIYGKGQPKPVPGTKDGDKGDANEECDGAPQQAPLRLRRTFLTSSVSGGSVGIYHFNSHRADVLNGARWLSDTKTEVLSPTVAWGLLHDMPAFLARADTDPSKCRSDLSCARHADRALVQEAAVAGTAALTPPKRRAVLAMPAAPGPIPVFNAAEDGGGRRALLSPLELAPARPDGEECPTPPAADGEPVGGAVDAVEALKGEHLGLATAALLSARFPVVAPEGRVGRRDRPSDGPPCARSETLLALQLRDGGYVENTGLLTIADMLPAIRSAIDGWNADLEKDPPRRVQILVVSIDDDPWVGDADPRPGKRDAGPLGITKRADPGYLSRYARDRITSCQVSDVTYFRFSPPVRVGVRAATGWETSTTARNEDLGEALRRDGQKVAMQALRAALDGAPETGCSSYPR